MIEKHPYKPFVPGNAKYLILGSFPAKPAERGDWYYVNPRNQFWSILEKVYEKNLNSKSQKQKLFSKLQVAITDIVYSCGRDKGTNLDSNLINITYNIKVIRKVIIENDIVKIFFTSQFVENSFKRTFKNLIKINPKN